MRKVKKIGFLLMVLSLLLQFPSFLLHVEAGISVPQLDAGTLDDTSIWNNVEEDVVVQNGTLCFPKESTEYTGYILKNRVKKNEYFTKLIEMEGDFKFTQLPTGKSFIIAFGLEDIESTSGEPGNVEIVITNDGGAKVGIIAYDEDGNTVVVAEPKSCGISLNRNTNMKAEIDNDILKLVVNSSTVFNAKLPVTAEGRFGFLQTGECAVEISNIHLNMYNYERPQNTNIEEDFEEGSLNRAVLLLNQIALSAYKPQGNSVEELEGNKVLFFENSGGSYLGTRHMYSNFEMSFDVPYLKTNDDYDDETGVLTNPGTKSFGLAFGETHMDLSGVSYETCQDMVMFEKDIVYSYKQKDAQSATYSNWKSGTPFSVKLVVKDGKVTVQIKQISESTYKTLLEYELKEGMRSGYVQFWIPEFANMAIDNLVIRNLDDSPDLIDLEFESAVPDSADAEYKPFERLYEHEAKTIQTKQEKELWRLMIPATAVLGLMALSTTFIAAKKKEKKLKEEMVNESVL